MVWRVITYLTMQYDDLEVFSSSIILSFFHSFLLSSIILLTMQYTILPATPADLPDIIAVFHAAFANDPFIGQLMPDVPPQIKRAYDMHWYSREFDMSELNGLRFRKVVDEDGYDLCPRQARQRRRMTHLFYN